MPDQIRLRVDDFAYDLPAAAIAQRPVEPRDSSRLLILDAARSQPGEPALHHATFRDVGGWLAPGDLLVVNDSRVIPARLPAVRRGGGSAEVLLLRDLGNGAWEGLVKPSRRIRVGDAVILRTGEALVIGERLADGTRTVRFPPGGDPAAIIAATGETPLPPYIHDRSAPPERYQTVYARPPGSAAAPTAGLHFTPELLDSLTSRGIERTSVTLHVGLDTFRPLEGDFVDEHRIHTEWYEVPPTAREAITAARQRGGRVVAVGTTSVRVLETAARDADAATGWTDLYITPPWTFLAVDGLITNFHLPRSSLLLLVTAFVQEKMPLDADGSQPTAFAARDTLLAAYRAALQEEYRFFSFGDAMLIV